MKIIFKKDQFIFQLFPEIKEKSDNQLIEHLTNFYSYKSIKPKVTIEDEWVTIDFDNSSLSKMQAEFSRVVNLCEKGKYKEAKPLLKKLIEKNPTVSDFHRIMGQILSDEGEYEEAINYMIDALRWDSKNSHALIMMGNIYAKHLNDIPNAMKYYDQALVVNPDDNIAVNNIAANLLQQEKFKEAKIYFQRALAINKDYPNTHFALGLIAEIEHDFVACFNHTLDAIKHNPKNDILFNNSLKQLNDVSKQLVTSEVGSKIIKEFCESLTKIAGIEIKIVVDDSIITPAKIEFAENYDRDYHLIKYKDKTPAYEHLVMHELTHLKLFADARKESVNKLFVSSLEQQNNFIRELEQIIEKLNKVGLPDTSIANFCKSMFNGINQQVYNAPIDLFIEDYLFNEYPTLRPYQYLSLENIVRISFEQLVNKEVIQYTPKDIVSKNKIYNLIGAIQFKELFGIDYIAQFNATSGEIRIANDLYKEFNEYRYDRKPGEEYELVQHWAEDLGLDNNFNLVDEVEYKSKQEFHKVKEMFENFLSIEEKPVDKNHEMNLFLESQKALGTNLEVTKFMVEAIQYFSNFSVSDVKKIAMDIATMGLNGINPDKTGYKIKSIPKKIFTGYHLLAYYYVSFDMVFPEMLKGLKLPYHEEYLLAKSWLSAN